MHPLLSAAAFMIAPYQVPPDAVPRFKKQRPVLGQPVKVDPAERERITMEALSDGNRHYVREICGFTGLRPGAQRRTLRRLLGAHLVGLWARFPMGLKNGPYYSMGVR